MLMDRVLSQPRALATLQAALNAGKVHHAWIFHGPFGVGKFTTALEFAKVLLDPDASADLAGNVSTDPASKTASLIDRNAHPDLHIIRKEMALDSSVQQVRDKKLTNIPIDLLRELMIGGTTADGKYHDARAFLTPKFGHGKVFIIDEAELLAHGQMEAQNALLKTLEEPPANTHVILVTTQEDRLLPTIRSRCQRVPFYPLDESAMEAWVAREVKREESPLAALSNDARNWVIEFAAGSPGLALSAAEDDLAGWRQMLIPMLRELDQGKFPAELGETLGKLADAYAARRVKEGDNESKQLANKDGAARVFMLLAAHARQRLHQAVERGDDPERWLRAVDRIREAEGDLFANVNLKLVMESLAVQLAQ